MRTCVATPFSDHCAQLREHVTHTARGLGGLEGLPPLRVLEASVDVEG
jgi:hypothetical protein